MIFCFCCLISISCLLLAFLRALSFFFQSAKTLIILRRTISAAILHFCWICLVRFSRLMFISFRSSCLMNFNNCSLCIVLRALSLSFRILNSSCNSRCCTRYCLSLANFSLSLNLFFFFQKDFIVYNKDVHAILKQK